MINIIEICNRIIIIHLIWCLLLLCKSKILNSTGAVVIGWQIVRLNHFDGWLVNLGMFSSNRSHSFFLPYKVITISRIGWTSALTCRFVILCLIASIIISIIVQKCTCAHIGWESLTSFNLFEILLFALNRILIILSLTICDWRHLRHKRMWPLLIFLIAIENLLGHYLLLYLSVLGCLLWSYSMKFKISGSW